MRLKRQRVQEKARLAAPVFVATMLFLLLVVYGDMGFGGIGIDVEPAPQMHIISIGINTYSPPLSYARADAEAFAQAMSQSFKGPVHSQVLLDEHATRKAIEAAMNTAIDHAKPDDLFVFYYTGLSRQAKDKEFYLLPVNVNTDKVSSIDLASQSISARLLKSWMSRLQASAQLLIFDTCDAEQMLPTMVSHLRRGDSRGLQLSDRRFMFMGTEGLSSESPALKHGVFTHHLLQGLSGEADQFPRDGIITADELDVYVRGQTLLSRTLFEKQKIVSGTVGRDFALAWLKDFRGVGVEELPTSDKNAIPSMQGRDYALLIATDDYDAWKRLSNPIHDARAIATDLREIYGFETEVLENPTRNHVYDVLDKYMERNYSPTDHLVIFIAGHGIYKDNTREGFLITKESRLQKEDKWGDSFLPHARLGQIVERIPAQHIFLIVDACFGGTFDQRIAEASHRGDDEYSEVSPEEIKNRKIKYKSRRYLTSGGTEYVPDGKPGHHSPFARKLLEALRSYGEKDGYLTIGAILEYVEKVKPEPRAGEFGSHAPGGDLVLLPLEKIGK